MTSKEITSDSSLLRKGVIKAGLIPGWAKKLLLGRGWDMEIVNFGEVVDVVVFLISMRLTKTHRGDGVQALYLVYCSPGIICQCQQEHKFLSWRLTEVAG